jgi:putative membrane protein
MMWGWGHGFGGFGGLGFLAVIPMLIFWGLIIIGVIFAIRAFGEHNRSVLSQGSKSTALDILKERYAKGEIDTQEYEEKKRVLQA